MDNLGCLSTLLLVIFAVIWLIGDYKKHTRKEK